MLVYTHSRGNIFFLSICFCRAFSGPPSFIRSCKARRELVISAICVAFCLKSEEEVSILERIVETACSKWLYDWVAIGRIGLWKEAREGRANRSLAAARGTRKACIVDVK